MQKRWAGGRAARSYHGVPADCSRSHGCPPAIADANRVLVAITAAAVQRIILSKTSADGRRPGAIAAQCRAGRQLCLVTAAPILPGSSSPSWAPAASSARATRAAARATLLGPYTTSSSIVSEHFAMHRRSSSPIHEYECVECGMSSMRGIPILLRLPYL